MNSRDFESQSPLERRSRAVFDQTVAALDADTRGRLARARSRAVQAAAAPRRVSAWFRGTAGWATAAASIAVAGLIWFGQSSRPPAIDVETLGDLEILLGDEELEMLEDLDFYAWLEQQPEINDAVPVGNGSG